MFIFLLSFLKYQKAFHSDFERNMLFAKRNIHYIRTFEIIKKINDYKLFNDLRRVRYIILSSCFIVYTISEVLLLFYFYGKRNHFFSILCSVDTFTRVREWLGIDILDPRVSFLKRDYLKLIFNMMCVFEKIL